MAVCNLMLIYRLLLVSRILRARSGQMTTSIVLTCPSERV